MKTFLIRFLPVLLWAGIIFGFSANPKPYNMLPPDWSEPASPAGTAQTLSKAEELGKVLHFAEYSVLAVLLARGLTWKKKLNPKVFIAILGISALYALSDEFHQLFVPGRAFQLQDLILDVCGAIFGILVFYISFRK